MIHSSGKSAAALREDLFISGGLLIRQQIKQDVGAASFLQPKYPYLIGILHIVIGPLQVAPLHEYLLHVNLPRQLPYFLPRHHTSSHYRAGVSVAGADTTDAAEFVELVVHHFAD